MCYKLRWQAAETSVSQLTRSKVVDRTFGFDVKPEHEGRGAMALAKLANHFTRTLDLGILDVTFHWSKTQK